MKIEFAGELLCDTGLQGHRGLTIGNRQSVDEHRLLRSPTVVFRDRKNGSVEMSFSVKRRHASLKDAESFVYQHPQSIIGKGPTVFTYGPTGAEQTLTMAAAALSCRCESASGQTTVFNYTIRGPKIEP